LISPTKLDEINPDRPIDGLGEFVAGADDEDAEVEADD